VVAVVVASLGDPADVRTWSGIPSRILEAVSANGERAIAGGPLVGPRARIAASAGHWLAKLHLHIAVDRERPMRTEAAEQLNDIVRATSADLIISTTSLIHEKRHTPSVPTALWVDAVLPVALNYTTGFVGIPGWNVARMISAEREVLQSVDLIAFASQWALDGMRTHYPDITTPAIVLPFGAINEPRHTVDRSGMPAQRILSIGMEWQRKGMDDLVAAVALARVHRPDLTLDIVGDLPPEGATLPPWVRAHGRLRRDRPTEKVALDSLFAQAGVFALLSRAECYGIVFVEAAAHGLPSVGTQTGGITTAVLDGVTGHLVPVGDPTAAAAAILRLLNGSTYQQMANAGRTVAAERSWEVSVRQIVERLSD